MLGSRSQSRARWRKRAAQAKDRSTTHRRGSRNEAARCHGVLDDFKPDTVPLRGLGCVFAGIALVHIGWLHGISCDLLDLSSPRGNLFAMALAARSHGHRQRMTGRATAHARSTAHPPPGVSKPPAVQTGRPLTWSEIGADTETYTLGMDLKQFA